MVYWFLCCKGPLYSKGNEDYLYAAICRLMICPIVNSTHESLRGSSVTKLKLPVYVFQSDTLSAKRNICPEGGFAGCLKQKTKIKK